MLNLPCGLACWLITIWRFTCSDRKSKMTAIAWHSFKSMGKRKKVSQSKFYWTQKLVSYKIVVFGFHQNPRWPLPHGKFNINPRGKIFYNIIIWQFTAMFAGMYLGWSFIKCVFFVLIGILEFATSPQS
jgi:hypothetical protein